MNARDLDRGKLALDVAPAAEGRGARASESVLAALDSIGRGDDGLAPILDAFLVGVVRLVGARAGVIRSVTPDESQLRVIAMTGLPATSRRRETVAGSCGVCGDALRCADIRVAADAAACSELASADLFEGEGRGTVAVPLAYRGRTVGVFTLFFNGVNSLRPDVIHLMRPIGQLLGVTLENAKLEHDRMRASVIQARQAMAGDIHDSLAQSLTFARMRMPLMQDAIAERDSARALKYFRDVYDELGHANRRLRTLITHFRAGMDAQGLMHALQELTVGFYERTGIELTLENHVGNPRLGEDVEVQAFHVVQEALANVQKHSRARHVRLLAGRSGDRLVLTVEDDGIGWEAAQLERLRADEPRSGEAHFGLEIMRERARAAGGEITIGAVPSGGSWLRLSVPLPEVVAASPCVEPGAVRRTA